MKEEKECRVREYLGKYYIEKKYNYCHPIFWWIESKKWGGVNIYGWVYSGFQYTIPSLKPFNSLNDAKHMIKEFKRGETFYYYN